MPMPNSATSAQGYVPAAPAPGDMRSYVHLNNGTISSNAINALPYPGPRAQGSASGANLDVPQARTRMSSASDVSAYSEDDQVGEAR